jgi:Uma2 family endonuclease
VAAESKDGVSAEPLPEWFLTPPGGWRAEDLDRLPPVAPRHIELIDGALVVQASQTSMHSLAVRRIANVLETSVPEGVSVDARMTVMLGPRQRPEPDVVVYRDTEDPAEGDKRTYYLPEEVVLVVEVVSEDSAERDRDTKPRKYAKAGIRHFWRVEEENGAPVVHVFELDDTTGTYVPITIARERLALQAPFPMDIEVEKLLQLRR